jgi:hypothetical protein
MLVMRMLKCDAVMRRESREAMRRYVDIDGSYIGRVEAGVEGGANLLNSSKRED